MKSKKIISLTMLVAVASMVFSIQVSADSKDVQATGALTTAPPQLESQNKAVDNKEVREAGALTTAPPKSEMQIRTVNPNFKYLYDTSFSISNVGSLKVKLQPMTMAYETVNSIGADVSLERWTGSAWITIQSTTLSATLTDYYNGSVTWTATEGFYYRGRSNHWVKKGTVKEEHVVYTNSLLVTK